MGQTLCADLRCDYGSLVELNKTFTLASIVKWCGQTSDVLLERYCELCVPETDKEYLTLSKQLRGQLSKVIDGLTTSEPQDTTVAEEWPVSLEFSGWASDDCIEFCNSHGLVEDLRKCRKTLNDSFTNIKNSLAEIDYYQDDAVDDEGHVVLRLEIESDRKTYRKEYNSFVSWMVDNLSDQNRMLISISIDRL